MEAKDTIFIDFGEGVGRMDYSQGLGMLGIVLVDDGDIDVHVAAYNNLRLSGTIYSDYFDYNGCYLTTYLAEGSTRFTDIKPAQMTLSSIGDTLHITLDAEMSEGLTQAVVNAWAEKGYQVRKIINDIEVLLELTFEKNTSRRFLNLQGIER